MSFNEDSSVRPPSNPPSVVREKTVGEYGVQDTFRYGFKSAKSEVTSSHPLQESEANYSVNREALMMQALRDTQGLHAALRLQMERRMVCKIQRLPPLESSMIALETLTGFDECLSIEEVLNPPTDLPVTLDTHAVMEKRLKMT